MDTTMIIWIILWAVLALCLPFGIAAHLCCPNKRQRLHDDFSIDSGSSSEGRTEKVFGTILHILLLLFLAPVILILAGNEQISRSMTKLPWAAGIIYKDLNTFLHNTHMQLSFSISSSMDVVIEVIKKDLDDITAFVGEPYQKDLSEETGIDIALTALEDLRLATATATSVIADLLIDCAAAKVAAVLFQNEVDEISRQITLTKQLCDTRDRPLCYTLQCTGYDVAFSVDNITTDANIRQLDRIRTETNFNKSIEEARQNFESIPNQVKSETSHFVSEMKTILSKKRAEVYKSTHELDVLARSVTESLRQKEDQSMELIRKLVVWDLIRWLAVLGVSSLLGIIWGLLLCGAPCGCGSTSKTISFLMAAVVLSCSVSIIVWALGAAALVIGTHGKGLLCKPLYDYPKFEALGFLFDANGVLYKKGAFEDFSVTTDRLKVAEVLKYSLRDQAAFQTFHLFHQINISKVSNYQEWTDLKVMLYNFTKSEEITAEILKPSLQLNLQTLSAASSANLTSLRLQVTSPITKRDLNSFVDQLHTVARQLSDAPVARKFDNIAFSVRKVIRNELEKLSQIKNAILLKITMLEVLLPPLGKQANQSLAHLKTIQYFLDNKGKEVAEKIRKRFVARLESYLEELYNYVSKKVTKEIGKCRPLWEIFHSIRFYLCNLIVDPMNAIAFSSFFLILLMVTIAPVAIKLVDYYKECNDEELTSISPRYPGGFGRDEEETWASPRSERMQIRIRSPNGEEGIIGSSSSSPPTPQRQISFPIPTPPRLPTVAERVISPRDFGQPSTSRERASIRGLSTISTKFSKAKNFTQKGRSPRKTGRHHESLRLVEPVTWKMGSTTPKSWI